MSIFEFDSYKDFVNAWIAEQPKSGHGQLRRLADRIGVNSVVMSQVFRGPRELTLEQAMVVSEFIGLKDTERDFLLTLVEAARAGSVNLRKVFETRLEQMRKQSKVLKNRIKHSDFLASDKATFYSQWYYSAIRLGVSIPGLNTATAIADHLKLERGTVHRVLEFLVDNQLVVENKGRFEIGPQVTHAGQDTPHAIRHHSNWRLKSLQALETNSSQDLFYTGPMAISQKASEEIHQLLVSMIEQSTKKAVESESETLRCLNVDWFGVREPV